MSDSSIERAAPRAPIAGGTSTGTAPTAPGAPVQDVLPETARQRQEQRYQPSRDPRRALDDPVSLQNMRQPGIAMPAAQPDVTMITPPLKPPTGRGGRYIPPEDDPLTPRSSQDADALISGYAEEWDLNPAHRSALVEAAEEGHSSITLKEFAQDLKRHQTLIGTNHYAEVYPELAAAQARQQAEQQAIQAASAVDNIAASTMQQQGQPVRSMTDTSQYAPKEKQQIQTLGFTITGPEGKEYRVIPLKLEFSESEEQKDILTPARTWYSENILPYTEAFQMENIPRYMHPPQPEQKFAMSFAGGVAEKIPRLPLTLAELGIGVATVGQAGFTLATTNPGALPAAVVVGGKAVIKGIGETVSTPRGLGGFAIESYLLGLGIGKAGQIAGRTRAGSFISDHTIGRAQATIQGIKHPELSGVARATGATARDTHFIPASTGERPLSLATRTPVSPQVADQTARILSKHDATVFGSVTGHQNIRITPGITAAEVRSQVGRLARDIDVRTTNPAVFADDLWNTVYKDIPGYRRTPTGGIETVAGKHVFDVKPTAGTSPQGSPAIQPGFLDTPVRRSASPGAGDVIKTGRYSQESFAYQVSQRKAAGMWEVLTGRAHAGRSKDVWDYVQGHFTLADSLRAQAKSASPLQAIRLTRKADRLTKRGEYLKTHPAIQSHFDAGALAASESMASDILRIQRVYGLPAGTQIQSGASSLSLGELTGFGSISLSTMTKPRSISPGTFTAGSSIPRPSTTPRRPSSSPPIIAATTGTPSVIPSGEIRPSQTPVSIQTRPQEGRIMIGVPSPSPRPTATQSKLSRIPAPKPKPSPVIIPGPPSPIVRPRPLVNVATPAMKIPLAFDREEDPWAKRRTADIQDIIRPVMIGVEVVGHKHQPRGSLFGAKDIASFTTGTKSLLDPKPRPKFTRAKTPRWL